MPRAPSEKVAEAEKLFLDGMPLVDIAKKLGVSDGTVRSWKNRYGWGTGGKSKKNERNVAEKKQDCNVADKRKRNVANDKQREKQKHRKAVADDVDEVIQNTELTDKQRLFCIYYIRCFNATKAYQKAYGCDYKTAVVSASRLLTNAKVKAEILKLKTERLNREMLDEDDIFQKYMDIAFADITDYVEFGRETVPVISLSGPVEIVDTETGEKIQATKEINVVRFKESDQVDGTIITEIKQGKDGASIKLADRMRALEWLADHMDLATAEQRLRIEKLTERQEHADNNVTDVQVYIPDNGRDGDINNE